MRVCKGVGPARYTLNCIRSKCEKFTIISMKKVGIDLLENISPAKTMTKGKAREDALW